MKKQHRKKKCGKLEFNRRPFQHNWKRLFYLVPQIYQNQPTTVLIRLPRCEEQPGWYKLTEAFSVHLEPKFRRMNEFKWDVDLVGMKDGHARAVVVKMSEDFSNFNTEGLQMTCVRIQLSDGEKEKKSNIITRFRGWRALRDNCSKINGRGKQVR